MNRSGFLLFPVLLLIISCVPQKKLDYLQTDLDDELYINETKSLIIIQPGDELYIRVSTLDEISYNFFNTQATTSQMNLNNDLSVSLVSFPVNDSGYVIYPIAGSILVKDLTEEEVAEKLQSVLSEYFNQPSVTVKKVNKTITVLGEVRTPGLHTYTQKDINIFEALGLAGDITIHGNKDEVTLLRDTEGTINRWTIKLTDDSVITSPHYYLKTGDVVVVRSRRTALWSVTTSTLSLVLASITTLLVVLSYFQ